MGTELQQRTLEGAYYLTIDFKPSESFRSVPGRRKDGQTIQNYNQVFTSGEEGFTGWIGDQARLESFADRYKLDTVRCRRFSPASPQPERLKKGRLIFLPWQDSRERPTEGTLSGFIFPGTPQDRIYPRSPVSKRGCPCSAA